MKVLVVSLLRLGDFIQTVPLLNGLRAKSGRRVDVLVHEPTARLSPLMDSVDRWWTLDRDELQLGLGRADMPTLTALHVLKEQLDRISAENYDLVINATHTRFSGFLMGFIMAREKLGLAIDEADRVHFHSAWFRYLDDHALNPVTDVLNYTDVYLKACGIQEISWSMKPTVHGENEVASLNLGTAPLTVCQMLTSDKKKNWGLREWVECLASYHGRVPEQKLVLLGAPNERESLMNCMSALDERGVPASLAVLSLDGALALLKRADLLLTGDTSIKHLANAGRARVIEICLGSSDYRRTGVYKSDSLILSSKAGCVPCRHSDSCPHPAHDCAESLAPREVAEMSARYLADDWDRIRQIAACAGIKALRTRHLSTGFWLASDLNDEASTVRSMLNRSTWKFLFEGEHRPPLNGLGSESVRLHDELRILLPGGRPSLENLDFVERQLDGVQEAARSQLRAIPGSLPKDHIVSIQAARRQQVELHERAEGAEIQKKLIRSLKSRLMENP
jgi:ADP-heptose:LPS heptosyltransferase